jgi:hypothetical protein
VWGVKANEFWRASVLTGDLPAPDRYSIFRSKWLIACLPEPMNAHELVLDRVAGVFRLFLSPTVGVLVL